APADLLGQVVGKPARELEHGFLRHLLGRERSGALPADFHSGEEIRLRPRQLEQSLRLEIPLAEDLAIGYERNGGPAPVRRAAEPLKRRLGMSALELLREELPVARHFDADVAAQRVDHTDADPVQTAAGGIGLARELAAR